MTKDNSQSAYEYITSAIKKQTSLYQIIEKFDWFLSEKEFRLESYLASISELIENKGIIYADISETKEIKRRIWTSDKASKKVLLNLSMPHGSIKTAPTFGIYSIKDVRTRFGHSFYNSMRAIGARYCLLQTGNIYSLDTSLLCIFVEDKIAFTGYPEEFFKIMLFLLMVLDIHYTKTEWHKEFGLIVAKVTSTLLGFETKQISEQFPIVLGQIADYLNFDAAFMAEFSEGLESFRYVYEWTKNEETTLSDIGLLNVELPSNSFRWWMTEVQNGEMGIWHVKDLPPIATSEKAALETLGVKSFVSIPLQYADKLYGFFGLATIEKEMGEWAGAIKTVMRIVGTIFSISLDRLHKIDQATESEQRLELVTQVTQEAIWDWNVKEGRTYLSPKFFDLIGSSGIGENESSGVSLTDYISGSCLEKFYAEVKPLLSGQKSSAQIELELVSSSSQTLWVSLYAKVAYWDSDQQPLRIIGSLFDITEQKQKESELVENGESLQKENIALKQVIHSQSQITGIVGKSRKMQPVFDLIVKAAATENIVVTISGESGTGKELVARAIHQLSARAGKPFVPVNCGAIPEQLIESEFFGYKKGAFSGALSDKKGYLQASSEGTLFLDEVGEINLAMQVKLLRVLETGEYTPVGDTVVRVTRARIVTATNRDLRKLVDQGRMREDFFYRIQVVPIPIPPLRERKEDIPLLVEHFLRYAPLEEIPPITRDVMRRLQEYNWPGNVRELQNALHRFIMLRSLDFLGKDEASKRFKRSTPHQKPFQETAESIDINLDLKAATDGFEKRFIQRVLSAYKGNRSKAAEHLGVNRSTLQRKIRTLGIE